MSTIPAPSSESRRYQYYSFDLKITNGMLNIAENLGEGGWAIAAKVAMIVPIVFTLIAEAFIKFIGTLILNIPFIAANCAIAAYDSAYSWYQYLSQ